MFIYVHRRLCVCEECLNLHIDIFDNFGENDLLCAARNSSNYFSCYNFEPFD